ncbi:ypfD [Symbiodinium natans]|uniref:YpfD protein n=1 Tax=Symbiodinium natans TaxID=878477 RepID=A0A812REL4_9DINO|nr:ypfD [Symbiodinium natans]
MALLDEAFALDTAPHALPAVRLASRCGRPRRDVTERGAPSALASAVTALMAGVAAKRRKDAARATAMRARAAAALDEPLFSEEAWSDDVPSELRVQDLEVGQELVGIVVKVLEELRAHLSWPRGDMGGYELGWLVGKLVKVVKLGQVAEACVRSAALCVLRAGADAKLLRTKARSSVEDLKGLRPVDFRRRLDLLGIPVSL